MNVSINLEPQPELVGYSSAKDMEKLGAFGLRANRFSDAPVDQSDRDTMLQA